MTFHFGFVQIAMHTPWSTARDLHTRRPLELAVQASTASYPKIINNQLFCCELYSHAFLCVALIPVESTTYIQLIRRSSNCLPLALVTPSQPLKPWAGSKFLAISSAPNELMQTHINIIRIQQNIFCYEWRHKHTSAAHKNYKKTVSTILLWLSVQWLLLGETWNNWVLLHAYKSSCTQSFLPNTFKT